MPDYKSFSEKLTKDATNIVSEYFTDEYVQKNVIKYVEKYSLIAGEKIINSKEFEYIDDYRLIVIHQIVVEYIFWEFIYLDNVGINITTCDNLFEKIINKILDMYKGILFLSEPNNKKYLDKIDKYVKKIHNEFIEQHYNICKFHTLFNIYESNKFDILSIKLGEDMVKIIDTFDKYIFQGIKNLRDNLKDKLGYDFPIIHLLDEPNFKDNEYKIFIRDKVVYQGTFEYDNFDSVVDVINQLKPLLIKYVHKIFSVRDTYIYLEHVKKEHCEKVVESLLNLLDINDIKTIFCNLIQKEISIRDLPYVVENLANFARFDKDVNILTEKMIQVLK